MTFLSNDLNGMFCIHPCSLFTCNSNFPIFVLDAVFLSVPEGTHAHVCSVFFFYERERNTRLFWPETALKRKRGCRKLVQ